VGQEFDVAIDGSVRRGEISSVASDRVEFALRERVSTDPAPRHVALILSVFKFDRMEWAIEKAVELGVTTIVPVIARRTEPHLAKAAGKRVERWRRIAREAAQQSRRATGPEIASPVAVKDAAAKTEGLRILLSEHESPQRRPLKEVLAEDSSSPLTLAIGPEGGWTTDELTLFQGSGWRFASLGPTVLRVETATIAALAVAIS
jgi:16S rRNA (uracil1498-N3)-methyltransferase